MENHKMFNLFVWSAKRIWLNNEEFIGKEAKGVVIRQRWAVKTTKNTKDLGKLEVMPNANEQRCKNVEIKRKKVMMSFEMITIVFYFNYLLLRICELLDPKKFSFWEICYIVKYHIMSPYRSIRLYHYYIIHKLRAKY